METIQHEIRKFVCKGDEEEDCGGWFEEDSFNFSPAELELVCQNCDRRIILKADKIIEEKI